MWMGEPVDFGHRDGDYELFSIAAAGAAAQVDADAARVFIRRMGLLDSTAVLDQDDEMQRHIETVFQAMMKTPRPPAGPSRDDMVALVAEAAESASSPA